MREWNFFLIFLTIILLFLGLTGCRTTLECVIRNDWPNEDKPQTEIRAGIEKNWD